MKTHHITREKDGIFVLVLNRGSEIGAEAEAMLQALHSRSLGGIRAHLNTLEEKGPGKFMETFYVGYGHKSIGDNGDTTIFIEGISMLAAKAIQDWPLYSGQESSTRYIDFATQRFLNITGTDEGDLILEKWRAFYIGKLPFLVKSLKKRFPRQEGENEKIYEKAINARAFDIMRAFLPAGATTNVAWHTNLRQAADKLMLLRHHPLKEVRMIADLIEDALNEAYPHSFGHKRYPATEKYNEEVMKHYYYHDPSFPLFAVSGLEHISLDDVPEEILRDRPAKTELPKWLNEKNGIRFEFLLDFGSFRDIQRHRAVVQRMPLLTDELGFEEWYLSELPEDIRQDAELLLEQQEEAIHSLGLSKEEVQYYLPMGYRVSNRLTGGLSALVYLVELRATRFVHPTLVKVARKMAKALQDAFPQLTLHLDDEPHRFDVRRGEQDIIKKEAH